jgi:hypothetical protein
MASIVNAPDDFRGYYLPGALTYYVVSDAASIETRMENALPGDVIGIREGTYNFSGSIIVNDSGTSVNPIYVVGLGRKVLLVGPDYETNMQLVRISADFWRIKGINMRQANSLLWIYRGNFNIVEDCELYEAGESILHIKGMSRYNTIRRCVIHHTRMDPLTNQPAEAVYVGTDIASWAGSTFSMFNNGTGNAGEPDDSSFNIIEDCIISNSYAENIEFKEGTRHNIARRNILDGTGMRIDGTSEAKNIMCKGNFCEIYDNFFKVPASDAIALTNASDNSIGATDNYIGPNLYDYTAPYPGGTVDKKVDAGTLSANNYVSAEQRVIAGTDPGIAANLMYSRPNFPVVVTKTAAYTASNADEIILGSATSAAFTVTLPTAVGIAGKKMTIKKIDSSGNAVTIDGNGSQTIDGATTIALSAQWAHRTIVSDGTNWLTIGQ